MESPARALNAAAWSQMLELWEDSPSLFEQLAAQFSRGLRPAFGSITIHFRDGKPTRLDKQETLA